MSGGGFVARAPASPKPRVPPPPRGWAGVSLSEVGWAELAPAELETAPPPPPPLAWRGPFPPPGQRSAAPRHRFDRLAPRRAQQPGRLLSPAFLLASRPPRRGPPPPPPLARSLDGAQAGEGAGSDPPPRPLRCICNQAPALYWRGRSPRTFPLALAPPGEEAAGGSPSGRTGRAAGERPEQPPVPAPALPGSSSSSAHAASCLSPAQSTAAPCQEPPPALAGGPAHLLPWTPSTAEVASETWLDAIWAAAAAAAALPDHPAAASGDQFYFPGDVLQDGAPSGDQLSTQLFRNQQLRDILVQKEVELARLQEENQHLRHFLNSAMVKQLEEKTKKLLLLQDGQDVDGTSKIGKRHRKTESRVAHEGRHPPKARRNLLGAFSACEEQPAPPVDSWVLQTLGLKDVDTVDESANYSASTLDLPPLGPSLWGPFGASDPGVSEGQPGGSVPLTSLADSTASPFPSPCSLPCLSDRPSPAKMDVAFTTSLSPHCNVKTHTFRQGQAFVRRDEDGGWKLTWVPTQSE
ncbi:geminin coiled-coil domain-containing protein 1 [Pituophis catenifer annectens]|uniref:geminin coiled-coil domain-containing protein 1 n=1 Tax=Pituophis catenifer annectens TaxID=94852 RepID=UPI003992D88D